MKCDSAVRNGLVIHAGFWWVLNNTAWLMGTLWVVGSVMGRVFLASWLCKQRVFGTVKSQCESLNGSVF